MATYFVNLDISAEEMMRFYRSEVYWAHAFTDDGQKLQFPAANLRAFVTPYGIYGRFRIRIDGNNKLLDITKIE